MRWQSSLQPQHVLFGGVGLSEAPNFDPSFSPYRSNKICLYSWSVNCVQWSVGLILNSLIRQYNQFSGTYYSILSWCRPLAPTFTFLTGFIPLVWRICAWKSDMENIRKNDDVSSIKKHSYLPVLGGVWICVWTGVDGSLLAEHILNDIRVDDIWLNIICWSV